MLQSLANIDPLTGGIAILACVVIGFALWLKAEKPLFGIPFLLVAGFIGLNLFRRIGG